MSVRVRVNGGVGRRKGGEGVCRRKGEVGVGRRKAGEEATQFRGYWFRV